MRPSGCRSSSTASRSARRRCGSTSCRARCACVFRRSALAVACAALAVLVAAGELTGADQWAVDHLMPGSTGTSPPPTLLEALVPLYHASWSRPLDVVANVVTLPAQALVSTAIVAACCFVLLRRGRRGAAVTWGAAWLPANAVQAPGKAVLPPPLLPRHGATTD